MAGILIIRGGGYVLGPNLRLVVASPYVPPTEGRTLSPLAVTVDSTIQPGTEIAALVFSGYPATSGPASPFSHEFTNEFQGVSRTVILTSNAGGRVGLTGDWDTGYKLVAGGTAMTAGNYTITITVSGFPETFNIALTVESEVVIIGQTLFADKVENFDTIASWADQEVSIAKSFAKGDVPNGAVAIMTVDGVRIPQQVSNRTTWPDGSLKLAQVRFLMPSIPAGQFKTVTWQRAAGTWTANDVAFHTTTASITSKVSLEYSFTSYQGRNAAGVLTAQRGPKRFLSNNMLGSANSSWVEQIMRGPVCCEWRATDLPVNASGTKLTSDNLACMLYARAWGGTTNGNPKRIQFLYRSMYGWSTDVAADEQGLRVDLDLKVNGTTVRGAAAGTPGWGAVNTWKGGFVVSAGTEGTMDWFDVASNSFVTPPKIIYRHDVTYGVKSKFFPPFDTSNTAFPMTPGVQTYLPGQRGPLREEQDAVADHEMIPWTTAKPMARCIAAHARATAQQLSDHQRYARSAGWGMGAMTSVGFNRATRKIVCHLPPSKSTNQAVLGGSVYVPESSPLYKIAEATENLRWRNGGTAPEIKNLDSAHFPQMAHWPYISEGDQHWLDLMYHEATLPSLFTSPAYGFHGTLMGVPYGGVLFDGQIRSVGHTARPIGNALGAGNPNDPHWVMVRDMMNHYNEMIDIQLISEDTQRGGADRTDGRRFQDLKLLWPNNEPTYKLWMHTFGLHATSYAYGISEYAGLKARAEWYAYAATVLCGGWKNDGDYTMKPDPTVGIGYHQIAMDGVSAVPENRRYWFFGQWRGFFSSITYSTDGQTVTFTDAPSGIPNGHIVTVGGLRGGEPHWVTDNTKVPTGLTRGIPYYVIQSSGQTAKLALSPTSNTPVVFSTGGTAMTGTCVRCPVNGVHAQVAVSVAEGASQTAATDYAASNNYLMQIQAALAVYQHYVAPNDTRVRLARQQLAAIKARTQSPNSFEERAKMTVPI